METVVMQQGADNANNLSKQVFPGGANLNFSKMEKAGIRGLNKSRNNASQQGAGPEGAMQSAAINKTISNETPKYKNGFNKSGKKSVFDNSRKNNPNQMKAETNKPNNHQSHYKMRKVYNNNESNRADHNDNGQSGGDDDDDCVYMGVTHYINLLSSEDEESPKAYKRFDKKQNQNCNEKHKFQRNYKDFDNQNNSKELAQEIDNKSFDESVNDELNLNDDHSENENIGNKDDDSHDYEKQNKNEKSVFYEYSKLQTLEYSKQAQTTNTCNINIKSMQTDINESKQDKPKQTQNNAFEQVKNNNMEAIDKNKPDIETTTAPNGELEANFENSMNAMEKATETAIIFQEKCEKQCEKQTTVDICYNIGNNNENQNIKTDVITNGETKFLTIEPKQVDFEKKENLVSNDDATESVTDLNSNYFAENSCEEIYPELEFLQNLENNLSDVNAMERELDHALEEIDAKANIQQNDQIQILEDIQVIAQTSDTSDSNDILDHEDLNNEKILVENELWKDKENLDDEIIETKETNPCLEEIKTNAEEGKLENTLEHPSKIESDGSESDDGSGSSDSSSSSNDGDSSYDSSTSEESELESGELRDTDEESNGDEDDNDGAPTAKKAKCEN